MKKFIKVSVTSLVLALVVVACALCACSSKIPNATFKDKQAAMGGIVWTYTLKLEDGNATLAVTDENEEPIAAPFDKVAAAFGKTGTYTFKDNTYSVVLGDKTYNSTYDESTKTYTINYSIVGQDTTVNLKLTYTAK